MFDLYLTTPDNQPGSKVGAQRTGLSYLMAKVSFLQSTGKIKKVAEKHEITTEDKKQLIIGLYDPDAPKFEDVKKDSDHKDKS